MTMKSSRIALAVVGLALITVAGSAIYVLSVVLSDHLTYRRSDLAYRLTVTSDTIRGFPTFAKDERQVDYTYSARDGTAPEHIELTYASEIHPDELVQAHRFHCERQGFEFDDARGSQLLNVVRCTARDYFITTAVHPRDNGETRVSVSFIGR